ncbi:MAG: hypothetical protein IEMM0008_0408 [bacterium]|nr:MAG: hypothetical protein IEMM0008_0408 [bacterium]
MQWSEVLEEKCLEDLSYKIELNEWGKIVMSPASNSHGMYQLEIGYALKHDLASFFVHLLNNVSSTRN